ncbi:COG3740 Phage head maturation protease [uncultured Caudovirales phage]|uniref:COG3740 Phage head maturation protease n=1 Tax=uncultured Caudovirales phage TaxID=2100421 RepID=A0A6J5RBR9_9CAUD|nr:COG3740 Phage head maturation protease [uncultured Caudovirales phage]CAB4185347.1 COG3740 Phage head maturation protease [uncultured Caudovirales phage]CAB4188428.1 COG3740 Phage head maturation protease [uncultured Caudovirales phage]CAB4191178.1 COG3740 Phage head maturation protease [uncultured Caudovirales phage]CAB5230073.1 COG3740 Phage head maturation protease [uncultured Caudovirales phage]
MNALSRDFTADLEIRADGTGRTIHGLVVPFNVTARVSDGGPSYQEQFQRGAFTKTLTERRSPVKLLSQHNSSNPIGIATNMREDTAGLYGEFRVSNTASANDQLELARDGVLDSFSVGFTPIKATRRGETTIRTEVALREVSLVTFPAYEGAAVAGIRALDPGDAALAQQLLTILAVADAQLDPIVEALCCADGALEAAQAVIAQILKVPNPDMEDMMEPADVAAPADPAMLTNSDHMTSLARRLGIAIAARNTATATAAGADEPLMHSGRLIVARNNLRAALIERGIR